MINGRRNIFAFVLLLIVFCFIPLLPAADAAEKGKEKARITAKKKLRKIPLRITSMPDPKNTTPAAKVAIALQNEFLRRYPEIELSKFSGISIANISWESKLMLAIAGGAAPDILPLNFRMSDTYIQQNFMYPLDDYVKEKYGSIEKYLATLPPAVRPVLYREGPGIDKFKKGMHIWGLNHYVSTRALFWRKDLFQDVGLDPEKPPKTWDEFLNYARILADPARDRYGMNVSAGDQGAWDFLPYLWGAGGEAVIQDKDGKWRAAFGSREAAVALDFYLKLITERWVDADGVVQHGYSTVNADKRSVTLALQAGKVGMYSNYLRTESMGGDVDPALVGITTFPVGPAGSHATEVNASVEGIFSGIAPRKNSEGELISAEEIRDAAWKYISFYNSDEAKKLYTDAMVQVGMGRQISPEYLRKYGYEEYLKFFPKGWEKAYRDSVYYGKPEPYGRNCQLVYLYMTKPLDEARQLAREGKLPLGDAPEIKEKRLQILQKLLKAAEDRTNFRMIGNIPPDVRKKQLSITAIAAVCILALFCFVLYNIWQVFSPKDSYSGKKKGWEFRKNWLGYLIMIPALGSILLWVYYPMYSGSQILFQEYRVVGNSEWVGLSNLAGVLFSDEWWAAIWNTFRYMSYLLTLGFLAPIVLAILLQEVSCGKIFYRTVFYLPAVMSGLVVIFMWRLFYQSGSSGILNQVIANISGLVGISFEPVAWLEDAKWAMFACVIPTIWAHAGPGCLIYLAALKGVPDDTYEAAEIDGANFFQKIWHVTIPTLKALIIINFVGAFISASQSGGMILIMTFGRANTEVAELHIFKEAYTNLRFGSAIAMAWVLGTMTILFTVQNLKRLSKMEFKTTGK